MKDLRLLVALGCLFVGGSLAAAAEEAVKTAAVSGGEAIEKKVEKHADEKAGKRKDLGGKKHSGERKHLGEKGATEKPAGAKGERSRVGKKGEKHDKEGGKKHFADVVKPVVAAVTAATGLTKPAPIAINLPGNFEADEGKLVRVSVGSYQGDVDGWGVDKDSNIYHYDLYSMSPNPWVKKTFKDTSGAAMKFEDVAAASDGTVVALDFHGKALKYDRKDNEWDVLAPGKTHTDLDLEFISVGSSREIWAVDVEKKNIYEFDEKEGWIIRAENQGVYVSVGSDGFAVGLNELGKAYYFDNGKWVGMPGVKFERVAVAHKDLIVGSTKENALWEWKDGKWVEMLNADGKQVTGLDEISINAAGTIFALDEDGDFYHRGSAGVKDVVHVITEKDVKKAVEKAEVKAAEEGKPAPTAKEVEKKLVEEKKVDAKAAKAPKGKKTRADAKKTGEVAKKEIKTKTSGVGKAEKAAAKTEKRDAKKDAKGKKGAVKKEAVTAVAPAAAAAVTSETAPVVAEASVAGKKAPVKKTPTLKKAASTVRSAGAIAKGVGATPRAQAPKKAVTTPGAANKPAANKPAARKPAVKKPAASKAPVETDVEGPAENTVSAAA